MTEQERMQLIIKTAAKHDKGFTHLDQLAEEVDIFDFYRPETLLYGSNLSLLKAACVDKRRMVISSFETGGYDDTEHHYSYNGGIDESDEKPIPFYSWVAQHSVVLPESERLSFIVKHLRKD